VVLVNDNFNFNSESYVYSFAIDPSRAHCSQTPEVSRVRLFAACEPEMREITGAL